VIEISDGFPKGYKAGQPIEFTLRGITNPDTTKRTGSVSVKVFYEEFTNEINVYTGDQMTF
jgi:hypothetical protein